MHGNPRYPGEANRARSEFCVDKKEYKYRYHRDHKRKQPSKPISITWIYCNNEKRQSGHKIGQQVPIAVVPKARNQLLCSLGAIENEKRFERVAGEGNILGKEYQQ